MKVVILMYSTFYHHHSTSTFTACTITIYVIALADEGEEARASSNHGSITVSVPSAFTTVSTDTNIVASVDSFDFMQWHNITLKLSF